MPLVLNENALRIILIEHDHEKMFIEMPTITLR